MRTGDRLLPEELGVAVLVTQIQRRSGRQTERDLEVAQRLDRSFDARRDEGGR